MDCLLDNICLKLKKLLINLVLLENLCLIEIT